jgi:GNAT superfamily N-acetyltransferase
MPHPTDPLLPSAPLPFRVRKASASDFAFCEVLTRINMRPYHERHSWVWRGDRFLANWRASERLILEIGDQPIGFLVMAADAQTLYIHELQIAAGYRGKGAGTFLMETSHRWARQHGLHESKLHVFADNPAVKLYLRMGYRMAEPLLIQAGVMRTMTRDVEQAPPERGDKTR